MSIRSLVAFCATATLAVVTPLQAADYTRGASDLPVRITGSSAKHSTATTGVGISRYRATDLTGTASYIPANPNSFSPYHFTFNADGTGTGLSSVGSESASSLSPISWTLDRGVLVIIPENGFRDRAASFPFDPAAGQQVRVEFDSEILRLQFTEGANPRETTLLVTQRIANSTRPDLIPNQESEGTALGYLVTSNQLFPYDTTIGDRSLMLPALDREVGFRDQFVASSVDVYRFSGSGHGRTDREAIGFSWQLDGPVLVVNFLNGDVGRFHRTRRVTTNVFEVMLDLTTREGRRVAINGIEAPAGFKPTFTTANTPGRYHLFGIGTEGRPEGVIDEFFVELRPDGQGDQVSVFNDENGNISEVRAPVEWNATLGVMTAYRSLNVNDFRPCRTGDADCGVFGRRTWTPMFARDGFVFVIETLQFGIDPRQGVDSGTNQYRFRYYERSPIP